MFVLTDNAIDIAIDNISGYIVSKVAHETGRTIEELSETFITSGTYALLCDKETGCYWDSIRELIDKFKAEAINP